jgi:phospholipase C
MRKWTRRLSIAAAFVVITAIAVTAATTKASASAVAGDLTGGARTPIQHVVVIFQENVSFDHYFGTYPNATGTDGNAFTAKPGTPAVNGLTDSLLNANPNAAPPQRLDSSPTGLAGDPGGQLTCDMDHNYSDEQQAFDGGKMDQFVQSVGAASGTAPGTANPCKPATVMDYYDGNTVTGLWNYAQNYAMSDNSYETTFGPSSPGAINLVSGDTGGVDTSHAVNSPSISTANAPNADLTADGKGGYSLTSDAQPYWDDCSTRDAVAMKGKNIGDLLNQAGLSWGWFQGGFAPTDSYATALGHVGASGQSTSTFIPDQFKSYYNVAANRPAHSSNQGNCDNVTPVGVALGGSGQYGYKDDYIPHHEPFQYYASTANPHHLAPTLSTIGNDTQSYVNGVPQFDTANHQYDTTNFDQLVAAISANQLPASALPAVSFIKAPGYEDGHAAYSDPADEQAFVVHIINELEQSPDWSSTAVFINYDDSDGWYDHQYSGVTNPSASPADNLTNSVLKPTAGTSGLCGTQGTGSSEPLGGEQGRCGFANRLPMLVISPYAKQNYVDHNVSDQASIINFVEYNWGLDGIKQSFDDALARTDSKEHIKFDLAGMFDFAGSPHLTPVLLDPSTGEVQP